MTILDTNILEQVKMKENRLTQQINEEIQYWTALQSEQKEVDYLDMFDVGRKQASLVKETAEDKSSSSFEDKPIERVTKYNITSYDEWLEEQTQKEQTQKEIER